MKPKWDKQDCGCVKANLPSAGRVSDESNTPSVLDMPTPHDELRHPGLSDSDVCHNDGQSEASKPTYIPCPVCKRDVRSHAPDCSWANEPVGQETC